MIQEEIRFAELLEKRKNLTATIWEEEQLIKLAKSLPHEERLKIDASLLTYSNPERLGDIISKLDELLSKF
jgi:hypothetical protein